MNKWRIKFVLVLGFVMVVSGSEEVGAQGWQDFSADMVSTANGQSFQGKIYVSQEKTRMDMPQNAVITRFDKNVTWMIVHEQRMYMEQPLDPTMRAKVSKEMPGEVERVALGPETVEGKPAQKFKITYTENRKQTQIYQWVGEADIPVKIEAVDGSWSVEYRNLEAGPQPDSLFEVPDGYEKFAMPAMPAGMTEALRN